MASVILTGSDAVKCVIVIAYKAVHWFIENKSSDVGNVKADSTYGTKRASAYRIMEDTLNLRDTRIFDYIYDEHHNKKAVLNHKETTAAQAKQEVIKQAFQDWIWKDPERRNRLVRYYNDTNMDFWHSPNRLLSCAAATISKVLPAPTLWARSVLPP